MKYKNKLLAMLVIVMVAFVLVSCDNTPKPSTSAQVFIFEGGYIKGLSEDGKKLASIVIPSKIGDEDVIGIDTNAFAGCTGLTSIVISDSVKTIKGAAFKGCTGLESVTGMKNVSTIGSRAFMGCSALTSITIPSQVNTLWDRAFNDCTGLSSLTIEEGVEVLHNSFVGCSKLTEVVIPASVREIYGTFNGCSSLATVRIKGTSIAIEGMGTFRGCNISDIYFGGSKKTWEEYEESREQKIWGTTRPSKSYTVHCSDGDLTY